MRKSFMAALAIAASSLITGAVMAQAQQPQPVITIRPGTADENAEARAAERARRTKEALSKLSVANAPDGKTRSIVERRAEGDLTMIAAASNRLRGKASVDVVKVGDAYEYAYTIEYDPSSEQSLAMISFAEETMPHIEFLNVPADMLATGRSIIHKSREGTRASSITFKVRSKLAPGAGPVMLTGAAPPPKWTQEQTFDPDVRAALLAKGGPLNLENPANSHIIQATVPTLDGGTKASDAR